ncbi:hypothetical protein AB0M02_14350 [Actinoplanes sp. NPDC051861]|uniref:hypothetical protein n=1 Tax=Actinoplanes sp. NPDC051861 TaxID=3155170 RepID=UPI00342C51C9
MMPLLFLTLVVLLAALARERRTRREFTDDGGAFRCRIRTAGGPPPGEWRLLRLRWSRRMWARWCGDVLVIRRGPVLDRPVRLAARVCRAGVYALPARDARHCGRDAIGMRLQVHDGALIEVTAAEPDRSALVGPFLAAAFNDLPKAPARRRET